MLPLQLDYKKKAWFNYRTGAAILFAAIVAGIYVVASHAIAGIMTKNQEVKWQKSNLGPNTDEDESRNSPQRLERLKPELNRANEIVQQLALPWHALFAAIEVFDPNQVALLRIETEMPRHALTITAEAKNLNGMLGYVRSLGKQAALADVHLINHQIVEEDMSKPVRFSVSAVWLAENMSGK